MAKKQCGLALLALLLCAGLYALWQKQSGAAHSLERAGQDSASEPPASLSSQDTLNSAKGLGPGVERQSVHPTLGNSAALEDKAPLTIELRPLIGTVVDLQQRLLPGIRIELCISGAPERSGLDFKSRQELHVLKSMESEQDGSFRFDLPIGVPHLLRVPENESAGRAAVDVSPCFAGQEVTLRIPLGGGVMGIVVEAGSETPVEGALLRLWGDRDQPYLPQRTGLDGRFRLSGLPPGTYTCQVFPREHRRPASLQLDVIIGQLSEVRIEVEQGLTLTGRITDAGTGRAIEGARIQEGLVSPRDVARSDVAGDYVLLGVGWELPTTIYVEAEGYGRMEAQAPSTSEAQATLDFAMTTGRLAVGRVLGPFGQPLAGVQVAAAASDFSRKPARVDWCSTHTDEEGRFEITSIRSDVRHVLQLMRRGYGTRVYDFPPSESKTQRIDFGDLRLLPAGRLEGHVLFDDGTPAPFAGIVLYGSNADRHQYGHLEGPASEADFHVARTEREADEQGSFQFGGLPAGEWTLTASVGGASGVVTAVVTLGAGEVLDELELRLPAGSVLAGRVVDPGGHGVKHAQLSLYTGPRRVLSAASGQDGEFRFSGLTEASYDLRAMAPWVDERESSTAPKLIGTWLGDVTVGQLDLELHLLAAAELRGQVLNPDGEPLSFAWVQVHDSQERILLRVVADEDGRFEIDAPDGQAVHLSASASVVDERHVGGRRADPDAPTARMQCMAGDSGEIVLRIPGA